MSRMRITAGLGSVDDYPAYAAAGADELFIGYVPSEWQLAYALSTSINRREVFYYNVQIGSESELRILKEMMQHFGVPVTITFNAFHYRNEHYPMLLATIERCMELGFYSFIVADQGLLQLLYEQGFPARGAHIHVSGETGEINSYALRAYRQLGAERIIFHRRVLIEDMAAMIARASTVPGPEMSYEAFILNEGCHFHGGFCNSYHCDELTHICHLPYRLSPVSQLSQPSPLSQQYGTYETEGSSGEAAAYPFPVERDDGESGDAESEDDGLEPALLPGAGGCGLCALPELQAAGITHLKLVSRGAGTEETLRDIKALRTALDLLEASGAEKSSKGHFLRELRAALFSHGCSGNCYYLGQVRDLSDLK